MTLRLSVHPGAPETFPDPDERKCTKIVVTGVGEKSLISLDDLGSNVSVIVDAHGISWDDETPVGTNPRKTVYWPGVQRDDGRVVDAADPDAIVNVQVDYA